jgi:hypothetical protein
MSRTKKILLGIVLVLLALLAWPFWIFFGYSAYNDMMNPTWVAFSDKEAETSPECKYPWQNVRMLPPVLRPGTEPGNSTYQEWYRPVYYELNFDGKVTYRYLALYTVKDPFLTTCKDKRSNTYGPVELSAEHPPVAMVITSGYFYLETANGPNGGVPLEKLPLVHRKPPPGVSTQR